MQLVVTKVKLKPGSAKAFAQLFKDTNPELVREEADWLGARLVVDQENNVVTVLATWQNLDSYEALASSERFKTAMAGFAPFFASAPEITAHDILVDMTPASIVGY